MTTQDRNPTIEPLCLPVPLPVVSLCFVSKVESSTINHSEDDYSDSSCDLEFRSSGLQQPRIQSNFRTSSIAVSGFLMSCDRKGQALLWDLKQQKIISQIEHQRQGPGLGLRRIHDPKLFMLQTRDPSGTVSIHSIDGDSGSMVRKYETFSQTFCQAAPCIGDSHLMALPSRQDSVVTVVDDRSSAPIASFQNPNHGMLTSLAMSVGCSSGRPIVSCGMESGSVIFRDVTAGKVCSQSEIKLGKDPVLALDLAPSEAAAAKSDAASVLAVAGMAGDAAEMSELPSSDQGTIALVKASCDEDRWTVRQRARMATCRVDDASYGKPGVSICRFRPGDGRLVAVGGWDHRVRIFERSQGKFMAILRGHSGSVSALDWAPDASESGLLATSGGDDNQIYMWRCYGN